MRSAKAWKANSPSAAGWECKSDDHMVYFINQRCIRIPIWGRQVHDRCQSDGKEIEALCARIRSVLKENTERSGKPYAVTVSIGVARYRKGMNGRELNVAADGETVRQRGETIKTGIG